MGQTNRSFIVCSPPHSHAVCPSSLYPHFCIRALHRPVPVRRRFRLDHVETMRIGFTEASLSRQDDSHPSCDSRMAASFDVTWINCSEESPVPLWRHLHSRCRSKLRGHEDVESSGQLNSLQSIPPVVSLDTPAPSQRLECSPTTAPVTEPRRS